MLKSLVAAVALITSATSAFAVGPLPSTGTSFQQLSADNMVTQTRSLRKFKRAPTRRTFKKSARQKCLDMMLPQDGADCMKKLKAKKNN